MLVYDDLNDGEKIKIYDRRVSPPVTPNEPRVAYHYGDMRSPYIVPGEPLRVECTHFIECIITGKHPMTSGEDGLEVVRILSLASDSMQNSGNNMIVRNGKSNCGELYIKTGTYE